MDSNPRRWVLQPLSPRLDNADLRSLVGSTTLQQWPGSENAPGKGKNVTFSQVEDPSDESPFHSRPSSTCSSEGSHTGYYDFGNDNSPEAEQNEAWRLSPQRQTQLSTLREANGFRLQTYSSVKKPSSLFQEQPSRYQVEPGEYMLVVKAQEERQLRTEIIRTQAPRSSLIQPAAGSSGQLQDGFSLSFQPSVSDPEGSMPATSGSIDRQQIDFSTARQQFQKMEQERRNVIFTMPRSPLNTTNAEAVQYEDVSDQPCSLSDHPSALGPPPISTTSGPAHLSTTPGDEGPFTLSANLREQAQQQPASDDSGDRSPSADHTDEQTNTWDLSLETPIEREMRLVQEREENLRLVRGLQPSKVVEMVEIKSKSWVYNFNPFEHKGKERNTVGFLIQREIQRDTKREWVAQQDNPNPTPNFNTKPKPQGGPPAPAQQGASTSKHDFTESKTGKSVEKHNIATGGKGKKEESPVSPPSCCPHRHTEETERALRISAARKVLNPAPLEDHTHPGSLAQVTVVDGVTRRSIAPKDSIGQGAGHTSMFSAVQPSLNISPRPWRESLGSRRSPFLDVIQKEIEENQRRESELRELRESIEGTTILQEPSPSLEPRSTTTKQDKHSLRLSAILPIPWSPAFPTAQPSTSSLPTTSTRPHITSVTSPTTPTTPTVTARHSIGPQLQRSMSTMLLEDLEESRRKLNLEESLYAGIQPVDCINNEVVEATRVTRHKSHKALRWEAGVFNN